MSLRKNCSAAQHPSDLVARFASTSSVVLTIIGIVLALVFAGISVASTVDAFHKAFDDRTRA